MNILIKLCVALSLAFGVVFALTGGSSKKADSSNIDKTSDSYIRDHVWLITNPDKGGCSGVSIVAPSGKIYVITAKHCKDLITPALNAYKAFDERGEMALLNYCAESKISDLLLLESSLPLPSGLVLGHMPKVHEHLHVVAHGHLSPSYRNDGELLYSAIPVLEQDGLTGMYMESNCTVVPGMSGGPVLNDKGELVGVISGFMTGTNYSVSIPLPYINDLLKDK